MAKPSIRNLFNKKARKKAASVLGATIMAASVVSLGLYTEDALRTPGESVLDTIEIALSDRHCAYPKQLEHPKTPDQKRLAGLFERAKTTPTGAMVMASLKEDGVKTCFNAALNKTNACGFFTIGKYQHQFGLIKMNPAERVSDDMRIMVMVHEGRHHMQSMAGADPYTAANVPNHERVILKWLKEADARMAAIVFAWEQAQGGNTAFMERLRGNSGHRIMVAAFENAINAHPEDMTGAMRAAIRASYKMDSYERDYANSMLSWMEAAKVSFDPDETRYTILHKDLLMKLGKVDTYGNYMNDALINEIRASFTAQDYTHLADLRKQSGGTKGAACGKPEKKPEAPPKPTKPAPGAAALAA